MAPTLKMQLVKGKLPSHVEGSFVASRVLERCVVAFAGARSAEDLSLLSNLATEIDSFAAVFAHDTLALVARQFFRRQVNLDPLNLEELFVTHFAVSEHLLLVLVVKFWMHAPRQLLGRFAGGDSDGAIVREVDEGRSDLSPIAKLKSTFTQAAAGNYGDGIGGATVDLDKSHGALAVATTRIVDAQFPQPEHRHSDA